MTTSAPWLHTAVDPRVLSVEILVLLAVLVGFRGPITEMIGTAAGPQSAVRMNDRVVAVPSEPYIEFPRTADGGPSAYEVDQDAGASPLPVAQEVAHTRQPATQAPKPSVTTYRVRAGDSLWVIAQRQLARTGRTGDDSSIARRSHALYAANRARVGSNPSQLPVGIKLTLV